MKARRNSLINLNWTSKKSKVEFDIFYTFIYSGNLDCNLFEDNVESCKRKIRT